MFHRPPFRPGVETYGGVASHHNMSLQAYRGKPVYMAEGHMLWRSFWEASESVIVSAAWAVTTAAASFSWDDMGVRRITGPYNASQASGNALHPPHPLRFFL